MIESLLLPLLSGIIIYQNQRSILKIDKAMESIADLESRVAVIEVLIPKRKTDPGIFFKGFREDDLD